MFEYFISFDSGASLIINADFVEVDDQKAFFYVTEGGMHNLVCHLKEYVHFHLVTDKKELKEIEE